MPAPTFTVSYDKSYIRKRIIETESGCWNWQRAVGSHGYGALSRGRLSHRVAYEAFIGPIPQWMLVLHHCDNRLCCNPEHLFLGSHGDNSKDAQRKGRMIQPPPKLTDAQVQEIRDQLVQGATQTSLALKYKVSQSHISCIGNFTRRI